MFSDRKSTNWESTKAFKRYRSWKELFKAIIRPYLHMGKQAQAKHSR